MLRQNQHRPAPNETLAERIQNAKTDLCLDTEREQKLIEIAAQRLAEQEQRQQEIERVANLERELARTADEQETTLRTGIEEIYQNAKRQGITQEHITTPDGNLSITLERLTMTLSYRPTSKYGNETAITYHPTLLGRILHPTDTITIDQGVRNNTRTSIKDIAEMGVASTVFAVVGGVCGGFVGGIWTSPVTIPLWINGQDTAGAYVLGAGVAIGAIVGIVKTFDEADISLREVEEVFIGFKRWTGDHLHYPLRALDKQGTDTVIEQTKLLKKMIRITSDHLYLKAYDTFGREALGISADATSENETRTREWALQRENELKRAIETLNDG